MWGLHSKYKGCEIYHRPGLLRRGYTSKYKAPQSGKVITYIHHTLDNAQNHIDKLLKKYGDIIKL